MKGILNILKPPQMTSHDVVSVIRRRFNIKKVGHTGTLDPMAVGVLPICIGKATRIVDYIQAQKKTYRAEMTLGITTNTQDKWGEVIEKNIVTASEKQIIDALNSFKGEIEQVPPMFSAIKHKGKKLYELAREGISIERKSRNITIYSIDLISIKENKVLFDVECSKGTYVRTICHDIGATLGCGAHMSFLARLQSGNFKIDNTITIEDLEYYDDEYIINNFLFDIDYPLQDFIRINVHKDQLNKILNGCAVPLSSTNYNNKLSVGEVVLLYIGNQFIALGEYTNENTIKTKKLFS